MTDISIQKVFFIICTLLGFGLLFFHWLVSYGETAGFLLLMFILCMALLRWRVPRLRATVMIDCVLCALFYPLALPLAAYWGMYYRVYVVPVVVLAFAFFDLPMAAVAAICCMSGLFHGLWEKERERGLSLRDKEAGRVYELEAVQDELLSDATQIGRMATLRERARIAREIHDNAGHEIVAAYISLQTAREAFGEENPKALALYDAALTRLDTGVEKIREAVHNLAPVAALGVDALRETCESFPACQVEFKAFGDTSGVPVHIWVVLEACLNETLTNAARHAPDENVEVSLDAASAIIRLCVENNRGDGPPSVENVPRATGFFPGHRGTGAHPSNGSGLRNLRHRVQSVGGNLSVDAGKVFRVVCVIPITKRGVE